MNSLIALEGVAKDFSVRHGRRVTTHRAIADASFSVGRGEFVAIVGRSGSGKSTILNLIAGLLAPDRGVVLYDATRLAGVNTRVGYMTQRDNLVPWRNVWGNLMLPLQIRHAPRSERPGRVESMLRRVGLAEFARHYPAQLSGGMRQRIALARMLICDPETLLMDEPFGALDEQLKLNLQNYLETLWEERRKTVVYVTHDLGEAIALADRVVVFAGRPGSVVEQISVPFGRPRNIYALRYDPAFTALHRRLWEALGGPEEDPVERRVTS
jgi:NitT/TauT family transport system ATP-binding protein